MSFINTCTKIIMHPLVAGPIGGSSIVLLTYLDSKYKNKKVEKETYYKLFIVSSLIFSTIIYFVSMEYTKKDEFLEQPFNVDTPSFKPKSKHFKTKTGGDFAQNEIPGPEPSFLDGGNVSMNFKSM